jgi:F420-non-reducing hydrogenase small subunit
LFVFEFKRPQQILIDEQKCLLAQGLLCLGPATRAGCEAPCIRGNMPCSGCGGPTSRVKDQGAKALSFVAALLESKDRDEIDRVLSTIPDPVGTFYRYSLPASLLRRKRSEQPSLHDHR